MSSPNITAPLTYYGRYLFAHSLTHSRWARLTAKDIHTALHHRPGFEGQDVWFYLNHPIRWIRVVGVVVAYDDLETRHVLTLDDGSGHQIDLVAWKTPQPGSEPQKFTPADLTGVALYSIVKAKGSVKEFWGRKQLLLKRVTVLKDTNDEMAALAETTEFKRNVLSKPWVVSEEVVMEEKLRLSTGENEAKESKRRKLKREKTTKRAAGTETERGGGWKENMPVDILVEKPDCEEERRKARIKAREHKKQQSFTEPTTVPDTGYRGRRRPPGFKPAPLLPPPIPLPSPELLPGREESPPITTSNFQGRRRDTPIPASNSLVPIIDVPPDPSPQLSAPPESTYRGRRRVHQSEKLQYEPEPETNAFDIPNSNTNSKVTSTYRGCRRASKPPTDILAPPPPEPILNSTRQSSVETSSSSYRGRRRISKPPLDTLALSIPVPTPIPLPMAGLSYRERWRIMKAQKLEAAALSGTMPRTPEFSEIEVISYHDRRAFKPPVDVPELPAPVPTPPLEEVYSRRGRRRREIPQLTHYPVDVPPSPVLLPPSRNSSQMSEPPTSSYRGRRRI